MTITLSGTNQSNGHSLWFALPLLWLVPDNILAKPAGRWASNQSRYLCKGHVGVPKIKVERLLWVSWYEIRSQDFAVLLEKKVIPIEGTNILFVTACDSSTILHLGEQTPLFFCIRVFPLLWHDLWSSFLSSSFGCIALFCFRKLLPSHKFALRERFRRDRISSPSHPRCIAFLALVADFPF